MVCWGGGGGRARVQGIFPRLSMEFCLVLTWINFNPNMDKLHPLWHVELNYLTIPFPYFNSAAVKVCKWISNFISHFTGYLMVGLQSIHVDKKGFTITMISHEYHAISYYWQQLFVQKLIRSNIKNKHHGAHYWPFVKGIHWLIHITKGQ